MSSNHTSVIGGLKTHQDKALANTKNLQRQNTNEATLPSLITKAASKQTYYTIRFLVDRDRIQNAFRTYAYFRWVDDQLDEHLPTQSERIAFIQRQQTLMNAYYHGSCMPNLLPEEHMLVDLIHSDQEADSGLQAYIRHMMAVMAFDSDRRGRLITQQELDHYTQHLAIAVTEAMHYFIGHGQFAPLDERRYAAVAGAHIVHMLRDTYDDVAAGYFNVPQEFLQVQHSSIRNIQSEAYRIWVKDRVQQAQNCFEIGREYLAQVENRRCRIAGFAYLARFQAVLDAIKYEDYQLRPRYTGYQSLKSGLRMARALLATPMF